MNADAFAVLLSEELRVARLARGWSLRTAAERSGGNFSAAMLGSYERAQRQLSVVRLLQLADLYEVSPATLLPTDWSSEIIIPDVAPEISAVHPKYPASGATLILDIDRLRQVNGSQTRAITRWVDTRTDFLVPLPSGHTGTIVDSATIRKLALVEGLSEKKLRAVLFKLDVLIEIFDAESSG